MKNNSSNYNKNKQLCLVERGKRLAECRKEKNYTQEQLAESINVCPQLISLYERGKRNFENTVYDISKVLNISVDYLMCNSNYKSRKEELMSTLEHKHKEFNTKLLYLSTLGYNTYFSYWLTFHKSKYKYFKDKIKPYIQKDSDNKELIQCLDNEILAETPFYIELITKNGLNIPVTKNFITLNLSELPLTLLEKHFDKVVELPSLDNIPITNNICAYTIGYITEYNNLTLDFKIISQLKRLCQVIDTNAKNCISLSDKGLIT